MVRSRRKALGLTQLELAERLGCGHRLIRELEHGKQTLQMGRAIEICTMLDIEVTAKVTEPLPECEEKSREHGVFE